MLTFGGKLLGMLILGIAGGTGCGKTTVVNQIVEELPDNEVGVISQDSYYNDLAHLTKEERGQVNFDHPNSIDFDLLIKHLQLLKQGKSIEKPIYSFVEETRLDETILTPPRKVMIVEGILVLSNPKLREMFDIKIYVHADSDERLIRRLQRDIRERGHDLEKVLSRYQTAVKPMHQQFIEPSKEFADIIIPNNHYNTVAVDMVRTIINERLG
ncbi:uridine kinase [Flagellimonas flava]|uniref:Uridine kinase n=2 Tax=Flagellimonas flava TaxID=570519 RepID=A0A1M5HWH4_9FLAO|nr:uridine kinase [Allomuricauda flava]